MINLSQTKHIQQQFSRAAKHYDVYAEMHRSLARRIMRMIPADREYKRVLDIGQGTGWMTDKIKCRYPEAQVVGIDLAPGMTETAKGKYPDLLLVQAAAEAPPFKEASFDLVTSNLVYQWLDNLEEGFKLMRSMLREPGTACVTLFGRNTLEELFNALRESCPAEENADMAQKIENLRRLPQKDKVEKALNRAGFSRVDFETFTVKLQFENMFNVLKWLKAIGANALEKNFYLGRNQLVRADQFYQRQYHCHGGVGASFEVFVIKALS